MIALHEAVGKDGIAITKVMPKHGETYPLSKSGKAEAL
jgi:hypothetical protein